MPRDRLKSARLMRVLIACEESGVIRRAFRAKGHEAFSCDLVAARDSSEFHIQDDAIKVAYQPGWDLLIFHWPCTNVANSGAKHLYRGMKFENGPDPIRWARMEADVAAFKALWAAPAPRKCGEWPIIHSHAQALLGIPWTQVIQPWQFGHPEMKATCLRLQNLPPLLPTRVVGPPPRDPAERRKWARVHQMAPGPNRQRDRSETLPGIAEAMALFWG